MSRDSKIEREIYDLASMMVARGVSLDDAVKELQIAYAEELEETAERARKYKAQETR